MTDYVVYSLNGPSEVWWFWVVQDIVQFCHVFVARRQPFEAVNSRQHTIH